MSFFSRNIECNSISSGGSQLHKDIYGQTVRSWGLLLHTLVNQFKKFLLQNSAVPRPLLDGPKLTRRLHVALPCSRGSSSCYNFLYIVI
jgi:hypothetical protein